MAELEELDQDQAARRMKVSRQTFGRILAAARRVLAEAVVKGQALRIEGGNYAVDGPGHPYDCPGCQRKTDESDESS
ncbi:MAG: DUF134 domain-containing protein [Syntrophales bacterium LBB04]|nr:DUF134 domain-containing protein [Syntrophales bacterium LBB04]